MPNNRPLLLFWFQVYEICLLIMTSISICSGRVCVRVVSAVDDMRHSRSISSLRFGAMRFVILSYYF